MIPIYTKIDNYESAIMVLKKGIDKQAKNADLHYRLGIYYLKSGSTKEAYKSFEYALELDYKKHTHLFDYWPQLKNDSNILGLIDTFTD